MKLVFRVSRWLGVVLLAAVSLSDTAFGASTDPSAREIRVQVVPETTATIGAPMAGRLVQFPLRDGDRFTQGQVLARFFCAEKESALAHAKAVLEGRRQVFDSKLKLHNLGTSSEVEYKVAEADSVQATADVTAAQVEMDNCIVTAPFAGRVAAVFTHNFNFVGIGAPLLEILSDKNLELELILPSQWLTWLAPGTAFQVAIDETGKTYSARLTRLSGKVDAVSRSIKAYGRVDDSDGTLLPGMSGQARFSPPASEAGISSK
jgi:membrane fusion protein, multidrug efflux system